MLKVLVKPLPRQVLYYAWVPNRCAQGPIKPKEVGAPTPAVQPSPPLDIKPTPPSPVPSVHEPIPGLDKPMATIPPELGPAVMLDLVHDRTPQVDVVKVSPFERMPGPEILKTLARGWSFLPRFSNQLTASAMMYFISMLGSTLTWNRAATPFHHMFDKYGPLVRLQGIFGGDIVFVGRPDHMEAVFRQEGSRPLRSALDSLDAYRLRHRPPALRSHLGNKDPIVMSGPEWQALRDRLEPALNSSVLHCTEQLANIADEFVAKVRSLRNLQEEVPAHFGEEVYKWALESVGLVALGRRLGCLDVSREEVFSFRVDGALPGTASDGAILLWAVRDASQALRQCESGLQLWRLWETRAWKKLVVACENIDGVITRHIMAAETLMKADHELAVSRAPFKKSAVSDQEPLPLLEALLADSKVSPEDLLTVVLDMLLIGVNATANAAVFLFYHLAKTPRAQKMLFKELAEVMPKPDSPLPLERFHHLRYLRACFKESLRLNPPIPVLTRILPTDITVHNYRIPKGTYMLMTSHAAALKEENFEDALKFKPERWLKDDQDIHPFAAIPFGHGPRSCMGRNLAELQLWMITAKIVRNFIIEYNYGKMTTKTMLIAMPDKPLKFRFVERSN